MRVLFLAVLLLSPIAAALAQPPPVQFLPAHSLQKPCAERPVVNLPPSLRCPNWGGGSCVHAATVMLLRWQGRSQLADWWRQTYSGGEYADRLHQRLADAHLRYASSTQGDAAFLDWALRTRRGAGITFWPGHAVNLVHLDQEWAGLLDNNRLEKVTWIPREEFLARWRGYGGWGWTLVHTPPPPLPCWSKAN